MNRRQLIRGCLYAGTGYAAAGVGYGLWTGIRFPFPQPEPGPPPTRLDLLDPPLQLRLRGAFIQAVSRTGDGLQLELRAVEPQPIVELSAERPLRLDLLWRNLSPSATLEIRGARLREELAETAVNRRLSLDCTVGVNRLAAKVPFTDGFDFAVTGDSGGGSELAWCLQRAAGLGADFVLHAGDFYYSDEDLDTLPLVLDRSPLPVYAAIGNHDFQRGGYLLHRHFARDLGPRNHLFSLGETLVVNFDTAASTFPVSRGDRAALLEEARRRMADHADCLLLTHRPLHDPRVADGYDDGHTLSDREIGWVATRLKEITARPVLLTGHIHISAEHEEDGIRTWISGDGLATRNLVSGRSLARILVGRKRAGDPVAYDWHPLDTPGPSYCHIKARKTLELSGKPFPEGSFGAGCILPPS